MTAFALCALLGLFILRVLAQVLIAIGDGAFLPAWEEWFSGAVPYPQLLVSQILIIITFGKICLDFLRQRGFFVTPRRWLGSLSLSIGGVYLAVMIIRYAIRMTLYPPERWTGGAIPIFFHWVLAAFILVLGAYHRRATRPPERRPLVARAAVGVVWILVFVAVLGWVGFQLSPTALAIVLNARRPEHAVRIERGVAMTTSDGVMLRADVYHPLRVARTPAILVRIPFSRTLLNSFFATAIGRFWAERGYTVVIQGSRGRYESGGRYTPLVDERRDGLETLDWLRRQPWFDGRLGMWGGSTFGYTQWAIADRLPAPPVGRSALIVQIVSTDFHRMFYPGGAFSLASALFWAVRSRGAEDVVPPQDALARGVETMPVIHADDRAVGDTSFFNDWVTHVDRDAYWQAIDGDSRTDTLQAPVLLMGGWFDPFLPGQIDDFVHIQRRARPDVAAATRLVIGPWGHAQTVVLPGDIRNRNFRLESLAPSIPWFDEHLRAAHTEGSPAPIRLYVMGSNVWRDEYEWPPTRARETLWYLRSQGRANSAGGDGLLVETPPERDDPIDTFISDPASPVPTRGGAMLGDSSVVPQNDVEARADVLVYSTPPLTADVEVTGPVSAVLYVTTSVHSADFTAKLVDVHPDSVAYNVSDGILRQTYQPATSPSAEPARIAIELWPTSMVFRKGHRIRLEIAGTNFPRFDRNPHTGESSATARAGVPATQAVHHGPHAPSRLVLSLIPARP
ncbi:MAG: CocE/NonD family hydrolase [Vicinamibacterales bacterium]|nr:CocE/NonD family hydrolase [Vicinamibacterales bacterium]